MLADKFAGVIDVPVIITCDSDLGAAVRVYRDRFPQDDIYNVSTIGRRSPAVFSKYKCTSLTMSQAMVEKALLANNVGKVIRPPKYDPPT